jgi:hypothetical protein
MTAKRAEVFRPLLPPCFAEISFDIERLSAVNLLAISQR